jgi:replicative DNA helicase
MDRERSRLLQATEECRVMPLTFDDQSNTATGIALAVQRHAATKRPPALVIVDYLSWIRFEGKFDRNDLAIGAVTRSLARMAKEQHVAVLLLCQINRDMAKDGKMRRPTMSDLKDSGSIEQDADQVVLMWEPPSDVPRGSDGHLMMEFVVAKNRHGPTGLVDVEWESPVYRYRETPRMARAA